jgi:hypothetical protein
MSIYYWEILKVFPNLNWETIHYENVPRIRFYVDELDIDLQSVGQLTTKIISELFENENKIIVWVTLYNNEKNKRFKNITENSLKLRWLSDILNFPEKVNIQIEEDVKWWYYFWEISSTQILNINQAIVDADFSIDPILQLGCYYFWENQHILVHLYDDRGMDIISDSQMNLDIVLQKWSPIIPIKKFNY